MRLFPNPNIHRAFYFRASPCAFNFPVDLHTFLHGEVLPLARPLVVHLPS